ncbi:MAG TPA: aminodeoxychorismate synthase component I [Saprospiraceae bacterium]|nr:aminodeoxychorismate synthase component I [Saprospiraceae bacterium]HRO07758.1 aminodeoxychorismate synthase component I [Saprospiraceae bacterium]HRP41016.1 aminodeoxychorismate synthase component I [Saprospiraceae bacterium]
MNSVSADDSISWQSKMNQLGKNRIPFLFILDFELKHPIVLPLSEIGDDILYKFNHIQNYEELSLQSGMRSFTTKPISYKAYKKAFDSVQHEIQQGNSFLLNLTFPTRVETDATLKEIFDAAKARYKLNYKNQFVVFSPEIFVQIHDGRIFTYPMKGTIDAAMPNAAQMILNDTKETAEHYTIVDLLRNDLSMVATSVHVNRFRYIDTLHTIKKTLLQVSSEIEGNLPENHLSHLGDIFDKILPAGSVSGAPKKKTLEIIRKNEIDARGYYTGIFGIFDGTSVDSAVMIRYMENANGQLLYRSGCGITALSDSSSEYQEMIDKVYVPVG